MLDKQRQTNVHLSAEKVFSSFDDICLIVINFMTKLPVPQLLRFGLDVLKAHNDMRALHEVAPMKMSETVNNQRFLLL